MDKKYIVIIAVVALLTSFAAGRYSSPKKVITETKIVEVEKKTDDKKTDTVDHKNITVTETIAPDGTKTKITVITDDRDTQSTDNSTDDISKVTDKKKETDRAMSPLLVSFMAGENISAPGAPIYGLSISRPILGPITLGAFGMTDRAVGLSIGLTF